MMHIYISLQGSLLNDDMFAAFYFLRICSKNIVVIIYKNRTKIKNADIDRLDSLLGV